MLGFLVLTHVLSIAAAATDATGTWTGELVATDSQRTNPAYLLLKQEGSKLTGSGGPNSGEQYPIQNGKVEADGTVRFEIRRDSGGMMRFKLRVDGDKLEGDVTRDRDDGGTESGKLATKREAKTLAATIEELDRALFASYNACDLEKFAAFFPESNIEFYHDKGGLATSKSEIVNAVKTNICGKVRRELVAGSLEVYPVPGYGAIETGSHRFFNRSSGKEEGGDKVAKFLHIWKQDGNSWKVTRVVSYAH